MGYINRIVERAKQATSTALAAPYAAVQARRGGKADVKREAVKLAREAGSAKVTPDTSMGRSIIVARGIAEQAKREVKRRRDG